MDYNSIVQALVAPEDKVVSTVECSWLGAFKILSLVEHPEWDQKIAEDSLVRISAETGGDNGILRSPDTRQFVILVMDGRAPILNHHSLDVVRIIAIDSASFSCDIDTENGSGDAEFGVRIRPDASDQYINVKFAQGHRAQNFIDEIFRAIQVAGESRKQDRSWLRFYEDKIPSHDITETHDLHEEETRASDVVGLAHSDTNVDDEDFEFIGALERESMARGMSTMRDRDSILKCMLDSRQEQYLELAGYKVYIGTWNVNGQSPGSICLSEWLGKSPEPPDFYAVGFQELDLSKEAFVFSDSPKEAEWLAAVKGGLHPGAKYTKVKLVRLVGMMLIMFAKENIAKKMLNIHGEAVGTGLLGKMGNKGAVAVRFDLGETSLCFVNCHLAAHVEEYQRRNQDFHQISTRLSFYLTQGIRYISDHDIIFWFGDMNYRIDPLGMNVDRAKSLIHAEKYGKVLEKDQLKVQMKEGNVFRNFVEGPINFRPTYKYDTGTDNWDSSEKHRSPAWCDRILWKGKNVDQHEYTSVSTYKLSDHKPVVALFTANVKVINHSKYRKVYEDVLKKMDKRENEFLPQVTVDIPGSNLAPHSNRNEIHFGTVRFMEAVKKSFTVANTGQVPVRMEFINKLQDKYICKDWLQVEPRSSRISPGETCEIQLQVLVDKRSCAQLNTGKDAMYDILILHLESGKDIFVTVLGEYERSVFGCSISALVNMREPMCDIIPGKLIELEKGNLPIGHYDIPKELWFLVDMLWRNGMETPYLFSQSGLTNEILAIRDWLNTIPPNEQIPGSVDSMAEALLILLESAPEPVIPFSFHLRCIDSASSFTNCKQIIKQIPLAHRNVFVYICSFLRELLKHSDKNHSDAKSLAMLFGPIMLREQNYHAKPNPKEERDKATFIYQFLVNEDYGDDL